MNHRILIAQSGRPTAVMNQSMAGIISEAKKFKEIDRVYGAIKGIRGIINEEFVNLSAETTNNIENIAKTPSSALGTTNDNADDKYIEEVLKVLQAHKITCFFYIGGVGSVRTLEKLSKLASEVGYPLRCIHIPKSIDNDLALNDHVPGFASAAKFVAQAFMGINRDNWAYGGINLIIVSGRNSGFLTAASSMSQSYPDDGPHLIYLPEREFSTHKFVTDVEKVYKKHNRCIVAVSEGIKDKNGRSFIKEISKNIDNKLQLSPTSMLGGFLNYTIRENLEINEVRSDVLGYLQRAFVGCVSEVDSYEAREIGEKAVHFAIWGDKNGSIAIQRTGLYSVEYHLIPLHNIVDKINTMPDHFINKDGNNVTDKYKLFLQPLLGKEIPGTYRLRNNMVEKELNK